MNEYVKPSVVDFGTLEELTASCEFPGSGDTKFPDTQHTKFFQDSVNICQSN